MTSKPFPIAQRPRAVTGRLHWIMGHLLHYKGYMAGFMIGTIVWNVLASLIPNLLGAAFDTVAQPSVDDQHLAVLALAIVGAALLRGTVGILASGSMQILAQRLERDVRNELYCSLLGKSQMFHDRQRVGDVMARTTNDVRQLNTMLNPGVDLIFDALMGLVTPLVFIGLIRLDLLLVPLMFTVAFIVALLRYIFAIGPVASAMRAQFGSMNARLAETIAGMATIQATGHEAYERRIFADNAARYRNLFVEEGRIQARYLPPLLLALTQAGALAHGVLLVSSGRLSVGELVAFMGQVLLLGYPTFISVFTFALVQFGLAGAGRILALINEEHTFPEPTNGYDQPIVGSILFENVTFGYGDTPLLRDVSFCVQPGQTVAIVGPVGAGKSTLVKLVNRVYDVERGRVLVDGVDVRDWNLGALRRQVATIEQDVFLFSRSIADNIAFGLSQPVARVVVEQAARLANVHESIVRFVDGYDTIIGERGVTLSGGQCQRVAVARALLTNPRILVLDDATSAIDSATEDEVLQAIHQASRGRTTLLITHRRALIRKADHILVLQHGTLVDQGTHDVLLARCNLYRQMFSDDECPAADEHVMAADAATLG